MSKILISINPEYVDRILDGSKKYEYRKVLAKDVDLLIIYSTSPVMKIVGEVKVMGNIEMAPSTLWEKTKKEAGISRKKYREYFKGRKKAYAYLLGDVLKYETGKRLTDIGINNAPQSFVYLKQEQYDLLKER
ncbi:MAG: ASCH domain-containing protein [Bacilli bacterium]